MAPGFGGFDWAGGSRRARRFLDGGAAPIAIPHRKDRDTKSLAHRVHDRVVGTGRRIFDSQIGWSVRAVVLVAHDDAVGERDVVRNFAAHRETPQWGPRLIDLVERIL